MVKSKGGCLKILACTGSDADATAGSDAEAEAEAEESKAISDKSRWSFRRRSTRHRVLKNSDISEPETLSSSKAKPDVAPSSNVYSSSYSYVSEKPLQLEKPDEKPMEKPVEKPVERNIEKLVEKPAERTIEKPIEEPVEKTVEEPIEKQDENITVSSAEPKQEETNPLVEGSGSAVSEEDPVEAAAVVIQSGIKAYMARQELSNHKDIVKLQAVIRGHLVRKQAVETLRCLLAIVKMQALVRAHQALRSAEKFQLQDNLACSPSEKLLLNVYALKIMDSMPTSKVIHIKCDPSKSDPTWKWMERWTTLIPPHTGKHLLENREASGLVDEKAEQDAQHEEKVVLHDSDITFPKLAPNDVKEVLTTSDSSAMEASVCVPDDCSGMAVKDASAPVSAPDDCSGMELKCSCEMELIEKINEGAQQLTEQKVVSVTEESLGSSDQQPIQTDPSIVPSPLHEKPEPTTEGLQNAYKTEKQLETEGKKLVPRKSCNPAFAAAQMKFQELSSNSSVSGSISSSYLDGPSKLKTNSLPSQEDATSKRNNDAGLPESSIINDPKVLVAASECGTEISISSTLDSPDVSEPEGGEIVLELGAVENKNYATDKADAGTDLVHAEVKSSSDAEVQPQREEQQNGNMANPVDAAEAVLVEQPHVELEKSVVHDQAGKFVESHIKSPEGTPRSRTTIAESHGTPSSEVSVNTKKSKGQKPKSHASKRSLSSPSSDSVGQSSTDNLSKESKHAKRESSIKVAKPDHVDQEPRISNSNPLPSYMQFTESARAKASANISPKLSPDIQENNPRKRHSLPMANGKQDSSPRMQRSSSQAQQNAKSNGTIAQNSSERRWQI